MARIATKRHTRYWAKKLRRCPSFVKYLSRYEREATIAYLEEEIAALQDHAIELLDYKEFKKDLELIPVENRYLALMTTMLKNEVDKINKSLKPLGRSYTPQ